MEISLAMIEKPADYGHLEEPDRKQAAKLDLTIDLLRERIKQA